MSMSANVHLPNPRFSDAVTTVKAQTKNRGDGLYGVLDILTSSSDGVNVVAFIQTPEQAIALLDGLTDILDGFRLDREIEATYTVDPVELRKAAADMVRARIEVGDDGIARPVRF